MIIVNNAFSLGMLDLSRNWEISVEAITVEEARKYASSCWMESVVGHGAAAAIFSAILGITIPFNRASFQLGEGDILVVGQYSGPRLPEGATTLPEGASIVWLRVVVKEKPSM